MRLICASSSLKPYRPFVWSFPSSSRKQLTPVHPSECHLSPSLFWYPPLSSSHPSNFISKAAVKAMLFGTLYPYKEDQYANQSSGEWAKVAAGRISELNWCVITVRARLNTYLLAKCSIRLCVSAWGSLGDEQGLSKYKHRHTHLLAK